MNVSATRRPDGWLRAEGTRLVDESGAPIRLRGAGLGNWFLPEGYMWRFPAAGDRPRRIRRMVSDLIGPERAGAFWDEYYDNYITGTDVRLMADWGFNSVRLPISSAYVLKDDQGQLDEKAMERIDRFLDWCRRYGLYVILDLHGAPGGQTGANIDDSEDDQPRLFMDAAHRELTVRLWRSLAIRYADEQIIGGYDLLNEPLPEWFSEYNPMVMPLYRDIIRAIREVDSRHMIILEGVHWATDWSIFTEIPDDNVMLQFHKYWNNPDAESIQKFLDARERLQVPIYMGEGGENNCDWYAGAFRMFDELDISWNFWTWKKLSTGNSPVSIPEPEGWETLIAFLEGGDRPEPETAAGILRSYLDRLPTEHCDLHPEVIRSLLRRPPLRIPAIFYSYEGPDRGFGPGPGGAREEPFRTRDGNRFGFVTGRRTTPNFQHGAGERWSDDDRMYLILPAGRWAAYDIDIESMAPGSAFELTVRYSGNGSLRIRSGRTDVLSEWVTGESWVETTVRYRDSDSAVPGRLIVDVPDGEIGIEWLEIRPVDPQGV